MIEVLKLSETPKNKSMKIKLSGRKGNQPVSEIYYLDGFSYLSTMEEKISEEINFIENRRKPYEKKSNRRALFLLILSLIGIITTVAIIIYNWLHSGTSLIYILAVLIFLGNNMLLLFVAQLNFITKKKERHIDKNFSYITFDDMLVSKINHKEVFQEIFEKMSKKSKELILDSLSGFSVEAKADEEELSDFKKLNKLMKQIPIVNILKKSIKPKSSTLIEIIDKNNGHLNGIYISREELIEAL